MLQQMLANVAEAASQSPDAGEHPLLAVRPEKRILVVVVTADRGLAGGFNANLLTAGAALRRRASRRGIEL